MSGFVVIETTSRWETSSLLRKLRGHQAHAIQVGHDQWLVRSPNGSAALLAELEAIVSQWAAEERTDAPRLHVDPEHPLLRH